MGGRHFEQPDSVGCVSRRPPALASNGATVLAVAVAVSLALVSTLIAIEQLVSTPAAAHAQTATNTHRFEPVAPCRITDERREFGYTALDENRLRIHTDACELPADAASIVVTTTVVSNWSSGWLVAYPTGAAHPNASSLNWAGGTTRSNTTVVQHDQNKTFDLFRSDGGRGSILVIDVVGAFIPAAEATAGRFITLDTPARALDTRNDIGIPRTGGTAGAPASPDSVTTVALPTGVPATASAVAVNLTVVRSTAAGFFSMYPANTERPRTSVLNADGSGQFRAGATIVPVTPDGFDIYTESGAHLIADITGYFTGDPAELEASTDGLFVPVAPIRLRDTRNEPSPLNAGGTIEVQAPPNAADASALVLSTTVIRPDDRGFITAYAARTDRPSTSSAYAQANEVSAQFIITSTSRSGVALFADTRTELTADLVGYFTGSPTRRTLNEPTPNPMPRQRVLAIGDSSLAGIHRNQATAQLQGASFDLRAVGCRRLVRASCNLGNDFPPPTAYEELLAAPVGWYDVVVIMTGYNDQMPQFASHVPQVIGAARAAGIRRIVWITHAREFRFDHGGASAFQVYEHHNAVIRANAAVAVDVQAFEWSAVTRQATHWLYPDGIHLRPTGGRAAADFISRAVAHITGQPCPTPDAQFSTERCPDPGTRPPVDVDALYGF